MRTILIQLLNFLINRIEEGLEYSIKGKMAKGKHPQAKLVLCTQTGVFYDCIEDASEVINMKSGTLRAMLNGRNPNKTNFILV